MLKDYISGKGYMQFSNRFLKLIVLIVMFICGCSNQDIKPAIDDEQTTINEKQYYSDDSDFSFQEVAFANELQFNEHEDVDIFVANGKADILIQYLDVTDYFVITKKFTHMILGRKRQKKFYLSMKIGG